MFAIADAWGFIWIAKLTQLMEAARFTVQVERVAVLCGTVEVWVFVAEVEDPAALTALSILLTVVTWVTRIIDLSQAVHIYVELIWVCFQKDGWRSFMHVGVLLLERWHFFVLRGF